MRQKCYIAVFVVASVLLAQAPPKSRILGVVVSADAKGGILKTDAGESVAFALLPETRIQKVAPGEKDLSKAQAISASDISAGDRVLVRGTPGAGNAGLMAQSVIVMSSSDIAQKQQNERREWQRRGVGGLVVSADPKANEIKIKIPSMMGGEPAVVAVSLNDKTKIRRYAPDSVRFADAKPGTLDDIQPGDQLRALGNKNESGTLVTAEEVVTGSFRTVAATITSVSADDGEILVKELGTNKPLTVKVTADSNLRKMFSFGSGGPMAGGQAGGGPMGGGFGNRGGAAASGGTAGPAAGAPGPAATGGPAGSGGAGGGPMGNGRRPDLSQIVERLPKITVGEMKPGETIIVASTKGASPDRLTAITLLSNADVIIAMQQRQQQQAGGRQQSAGPGMGGWNMGDMSMLGMQ